MTSSSCATFVAPTPLTLGHTRSSQLSTSLTTPRLSLAKPPADPKEKYIGTPPPSSKGRLRFSPATRFTPPSTPPPVETRANTGWQRGNIVTRSVDIWALIGKLLFVNWRDSKTWTYPFGGRTPERLASRRRKLAIYARERILQLGPTMVKVGQLASTRADLLPTEVVEELKLLQDRVPAFSWETAQNVLQTEYGKPLNEIFQYLDKTPIAAASLGQVHRAILPSGEHVVIKIQRPKLKQLFDLDLNVLRDVAKYLHNSKTYGGNGRDWNGIYEECARVLYEEIDYIREGKNCTRFGENFRNAGIAWAKVPIVYESYTTQRVLCLQYLPGIKISDVDSLKKAGLDTKLIANRVSTAFLRQVLDFTLFSSDPHPGNISVGANETLLFYDFGMMSEINPKIKLRLIDILAGVIEKDAKIVIDALVDLEALVLPSDPTPVRRAIQFFLDSIGNRPSRDQTVAAIGEDLYATAYDKPFRLPAASIFLLRAFSTLEAIAKSLDSEFRFADVALPYADDLLKDRTKGIDSPQAVIRSLATSLATGGTDQLTKQLSKSVVGAGSNAVKTVSRIEKMEKTLSQLERGDLKLKSRSTETERLLRKQYSLTQASNLLLSTGTTALAATQLYAAGSIEPAAGLAVFSAVLGLMFFRTQTKLNKKDKFTNDS